MARSEKNSSWKINQAADLNAREMRGLLKHRTPSRDYLKNRPENNGHATVNSNSK